MADAFAGTWHVTEHVFSPDGEHLGDVTQRRSLVTMHGRMQVRQVCQPDASLDDHPMAQFGGEWVFDLEVEGSRRRYLGPDVVGHGIEWAPGAVTARGLWPRFGCGFRSWSMVVGPGRQLTGGSFDVAGRPVATIVGVAVEGDGHPRPRLDLTARAEPSSLPPHALCHRVGPSIVIDAWPDADTHIWGIVVADGHRTAELLVTRRREASSGALVVR